jgi:anti-sigma B factor antagonist
MTQEGLGPSEPRQEITNDGFTPFSLAVQRLDSGRVCITVGGELDLANAPALRAALESELSVGKRVLLDLSAVTFIDSSGLAAIVQASNGARDADAQLELAAEMCQQARRLMELTGVLPLLSLVDGHEAAARDRDGAG